MPLDFGEHLDLLRAHDDGGGSVGVDESLKFWGRAAFFRLPLSLFWVGEYGRNEIKSTLWD